jgi:alanine racemase
MYKMKEFPNIFPENEGWMDTIMQTSFLRRTWVEIDLDGIVHNYKEACKLCGPGTKVTCVLKSNAYGHGAVEVAKALKEAGAESFAVSCAREALELRKAGISQEILVMTVTEEEALLEAIRQNIQLTVASYNQAVFIDQAAAKAHAKGIVHIKVDTGMHRLGFIPGPQAINDILEIGKLSHVCVQGLYSHLALTNRERDEKQHSLLKGMYDALKEQGMRIPEMHLCDSIGMVRYPMWQYDRVRTGALLFGVKPMSSDNMDYECRETLCMKTVVAQVLDVASGETVGYDSDYPLTRDSRVATLCAGYGDGYPRCMSRVASVLIRGKLAPVLGLVCMDQMMVDVTDIPYACEGDEATLLGGGISFMQYAAWANTNRNEAITIISRRPLRVYKKNGQVVKVLDYLLRMTEK